MSQPAALDIRIDTNDIMNDSDDSDDDDCLLTQATFQRPSRAESKKKQQDRDFLEEAIASSERENATQLRIRQIKAEFSHQNDDNDDDGLNEELGRKVEEMSAQRPKRKAIDDDGMDPVLSPERRKSLRAALDTEQSSRLGERDIIRFQADSVSMYDTREEALSDLSELPKSEAKERLLMAENAGYLTETLEESKLAVDVELQDWLCKIASSGVGPTSYAACKRARRNASGRINVSAFLALLECWLTKKSPPSDDPDHDAERLSIYKNTQGLLNYLSIWEGLIIYDDANESKKCLGAILRLGLDSTLRRSLEQRPTEHSVRTSILQKIISQLLSDEKHQNEVWQHQTAKDLWNYILDSLGPGLTDSGDEDDNEACLCIPAAVRMIPTSCVRFRALFALSAIDRCTGQNTSDGVVVVLKKQGILWLANLVEQHQCWLSIAVAYTGMLDISSQGNKIQEDAPRCLATLKCLFLSLNAGMLLLNETNETEHEYGVHAKEFHEFLTALNNLCQHMCSQTMNRLATNSYFQSAIVLLLHFTSYCLAMKDRLTRIGTGIGEVKQAKLLSFFTPKSASLKEVSEIAGPRQEE